LISLLTIFVWFSINSFSAISTDVFLHLGCVPAGSTDVVLVYPALDCRSSAYQARQPIIYMLLVVWLILLPGGLLLFLLYLKRNGRLTDARTVHRWGFLYRTYLPQYYWLEFVLLVRRVVIVSLSVLLLQSATSRSTALVAAFVGFLLLQVWLRPYAHRAANIWETLALSALALISSLVTGHSVVEDGPYPQSTQALTGLLVGLLGGALLLAVLKNKLDKSSRLRQWWDRCGDQLRSFLPFINANSGSVNKRRGEGADNGMDSIPDDDDNDDDRINRRTSSTAQHLQQPLLLPWELHAQWADLDRDLASHSSDKSGALSEPSRSVTASRAVSDGLSTVNVEMQLATQRSALSDSTTT